ncbi:MAG: M3 family metallopeptidase [Bacteroidota bacterium]
MQNALITNRFNTDYNSLPFGQIKDDDFLPAIKQSITEAQKKIDNITTQEDAPDFQNTVVALERSTYNLERIASCFFNLLSAKSNDKLQDYAQQISPLLSDFHNDIMLNQALFKRIKTVYNSNHKLQGEDLQLLKKTYRAFTRQGASLSAPERKKLRKITRDISQHSLNFDNNCLKSVNNFYLQIENKEDLKGLPESVIEAAAEEAANRKLHGWVFTLQHTSWLPFMKYAENRSLRKKLYLARMTQCNPKSAYNNHPNIQRIVNLRIEMAQLLGYRNYAAYTLVERMAKTPGKVNSFLDRLTQVSVPKAKQELAELQSYAGSLGFNDQIMPWDRSFYSEKIKKEQLKVDDNITRPWFTLERVEQRIFKLAGSLFGIQVVHKPGIQTYHTDIKAFEITDHANSHLGLLYIDYFPRKGKQSGAWMTEYQEQYQENGNNIRPHVSIVFNFPKPGKTTPSLLNFNEFTTFLHEFGHALHALLSQCKYQSLSGTSVSRDFVELPSQFMENFGYEKSWLKEVARHYQTGEQMPDTLINKLSEERKFHAGSFSARQLGLAKTDMAWHSLTKAFNGDVVKFERKAMADTRILPPIEGCATSPSFGHIFAGGYAAGYYGYKWAEVLDADAFESFRETGIFDESTARKFKTEILEKGCSRDEMTSYYAFRGREPRETALIERSGL